MIASCECGLTPKIITKPEYQQHWMACSCGMTSTAISWGKTDYWERTEVEAKDECVAFWNSWRNDATVPQSGGDE